MNCSALLSLVAVDITVNFLVKGGDRMKKEYTAPSLKKWGKVAELTQTGLTNPGADGKAGSSPSSGQ